MTDVGGVVGERLLAIVQRIERMEEEIANCQADRREIYAEARGAGFDAKTVREIVKLRKMDPMDRAEQEALLDIYKAALGMLADTPLGQAARRRLSKPPEKPSDDQPEAPTDDDGNDELDDLLDPDVPPEDTRTVEDARKLGEEAAKAGKPVTSNPFPAQDKRRAAWDEAWCMASGSDGMEVPEQWRRTPKKKPEPEARP